MANITTYLTDAEALNAFPQLGDYTATQQTQFLAESFGLTNSFVMPAIPVPVVLSDGSSPAILAVLQSRFLRWLCESSNQGQTEELQELYDSTVLMVQSLHENELMLPGAQVTQLEIGWNITNSTIASGQVYVTGVPPTLNTVITGLITSVGQNYQDAITVALTRTDSSTALTTLTNPGREWQAVDGSNLQVRFEGMFTEDESFTVTGIPDTDNVVSTKNIIKQVELAY